MKKSRASQRRKKKPAHVKDAWAEAEAYGVDMNLLEISLRRTPEERIDANQDALDLAEALQAASRVAVGRAGPARRRYELWQGRPLPAAAPHCSGAL